MNIFQYLFSFVVYFFHSLTNNTAPVEEQRNVTRPHIIVIMTDDMGWNDVGFHGSNEIPTPNIDALAYSGIIFNRHYTLPTCTPSRTAFLTGRHPIRMGLQGIPPNVAEPRGIPLSEKLLPEYLKELGYATRLVGKWHVGYYTDKHTPTRRGFDSYVGFYGGYIRYFNHTVTKNKHTGIDFHSDEPEKIEPYNNHEYVTDFITDRVEDIIKNHEKETPLYLQISHAAAHASENVDPIEVRNLTEVNNMLGYIPDINRRRYAGVVTAMDESVGRVIKSLGDANMLNNSIIVFMSDNGAPSDTSPFPNYGSNYPLRGSKASVFEGGIRTAAFAFSPLIKSQQRVSEEYFHITDWFPTLYTLAGGDVNNIQGLDGIDQWSTLNNAEKSKRDSLLVNIDEVLGPESAIDGDYKLIRNVHALNNYYSQSGKDYSPETYNITEVFSSPAGKAIGNLINYSLPRETKVTELRKKATIHCQRKSDYPKCLDTCLFNIKKDPCETTDISDKHPEKIVIINALLDGYRSVLIPQTNTYIDPAGYPENFNGYWMPWLDQEYIPAHDRNVSVIWSPNVFCEGYPMNDSRNCL